MVPLGVPGAASVMIASGSKQLGTGVLVSEFGGRNCRLRLDRIAGATSGPRGVPARIYRSSSRVSSPVVRVQEGRARPCLLWEAAGRC